MASKQEKIDARAGAAAWIFILLGLVLLTAFVYISIIFLILFAIYFIRGLAPPPEKLGEIIDVEALSDNERELAAGIQALDKIVARASAADLSINTDGSFHRGSRLGKELNGELERLVPRLKELEGTTGDMRDQPRLAFRKWVHINAMRSALGRTIAAYALLLVVFYFVVAGPWQWVGTVTAEHILFYLPSIPDSIYGSALISALISIIALVLFYFNQRGAILARHADLEHRWRDFSRAALKISRDADNEELVFEEAVRNAGASFKESPPGIQEEYLKDSAIPSEHSLSAALQLAETRDNHFAELSYDQAYGFINGLSTRTKAAIISMVEGPDCRFSLKDVAGAVGVPASELSGIWAVLTRRTRAITGDEEAYLINWIGEGIYDKRGNYIDQDAEITPMTYSSFRKALGIQ